MPNFFRQNEVRVANEPLKVQKPLLEVQVKLIDELTVYNQYRTFCSHDQFCAGDKLSCSRFLSDGEFQLTEPRSVEILCEVVGEAKNFWFSRSFQKIP